MTRSSLKEIVARVLEIDPSELSPEVELNSFPLFDSVNILMLMVALDDEAGIKLTAEQLPGLQKYSDIEAAAALSGVELTD